MRQLVQERGDPDDDDGPQQARRGQDGREALEDAHARTPLSS